MMAKNLKKENKSFISSLKELVVPYIIHNNIFQNHLYRDNLHLNRIGFMILADNLVICDALRDLVLFPQFKKHQKRPWRSVNFSKVVG